VREEVKAEDCLDTQERSLRAVDDRPSGRSGSRLGGPDRPSRVAEIASPATAGIDATATTTTAGGEKKRRARGVTDADRSMLDVPASVVLVAA